MLRWATNKTMMIVDKALGRPSETMVEIINLMKVTLVMSVLNMVLSLITPFIIMPSLRTALIMIVPAALLYLTKLRLIDNVHVCQTGMATDMSVAIVQKDIINQLSEREVRANATED